jgi:hypothetical protein
MCYIRAYKYISKEKIMVEMSTKGAELSNTSLVNRSPPRRIQEWAVLLCFVFVLGFSGCSALKSLLGTDEEEGDEQNVPDNGGGGGIVAVLPNASFFSGTTDDGVESAIDMIKAARLENKPSLSLLLEKGTESEEVNLTAGADIGTGLVLTSADSPDEVTIDGGGRVITLTGEGKGSVITVGLGVTLTLRNITFEGLATNNAALITVVNGGTLVLEDGTVIKGNTNTSSNGGGVIVKGGGWFTMRGGTISGNKVTGSNKTGGGVHTEGYGRFIMSGGTISGNEAKNKGGGVFVSSNVLFTKTMGTIYGNDGDELANKVADGDENGKEGFAVGVAGGNTYRNTTAGPEVPMTSVTTGAEGGWETK